MSICVFVSSKRAKRFIICFGKLIWVQSSDKQKISTSAKSKSLDFSAYAVVSIDDAHMSILIRFAS